MFKIILQLHGGKGGGKGGGGGSSTSGYTNIDIDTTKTTDPFSSKASRKNYNQYLKQTQQNYKNVMKYQPQMLQGLQDTNKFISQSLKKGKLGDDSYFKQAWGQAQGIDQSNLRKMNSADLNPYNDEVTRNYIDASNRAAYLANGRNNNQMLQNMIGANMANGSDHQTAAAKVGAQLAANINAQNQSAYMARQNQLEQNALAANRQLSDFYNTLSNIGLDYTKLSSQDLSTLLNAYQNQVGAYGNIFNAANQALQTQGQAVYMGSDPKETSHQHKEGVESQSTQNQQSGWDTAGNIASAVGTALFLCFTGDTLVLTPNGNVEIKDIKVGDEVYSFDSKDRTLEVAKVTEVLEPQERDIVDVYVLDKLVSTTPSQPFLSYTGRFVNVEDMVEDETTLVPYGTVSKLVQRDKKEKVYDIKISRGDCYFANGFVVKAADNEW